MAINIVTDETDPDGWPIRYVSLTPDVTRGALAEWARTQPDDLAVHVLAEEGGLSATEIVDVLEPQVGSVEVRITDTDA
ncbi:hypothetical protein [Ornithinimicrobium cerasi]|uniref:hypothetical protein n=1 Tax=Ornithinimicrobium cerasi TaxID=2248773 RepID=UPI000F00055C|nr:hypothetical protein [Ornithinimicrobium cerasi]